MGRIDEILGTKVKPKELTALLAKELLTDKSLLNQMFEVYDKLRDSFKGTCLSALTAITKDNPGFVAGHIDFIIEQIGFKMPRVKWEASEIIANIAKDFPERTERAIPLLLNNIDDEGTVVRWSAALALVAIAKSNSTTHKKLLPFFREVVGKEENNGVRNIYLKGLKAIEKTI